MNFYVYAITIITILFIGCKNESKTPSANEEQISVEIKRVNKHIEGYKIIGKAIGYPDNSKVYINGTDSKSTKPFYEAKMVLDSAIVTKERFEISLPYFDPTDFHYLTFSNSASYIFYIIENEPITIEVHKDSLGKASIKGGSENALLTSYNTKMRNFSKEHTVNDNAFLNAKKQGNQLKTDNLRSKKIALRAKEKQYLTNFVSQHPNSVVSLMLLSRVLQSKTLTIDEIKDGYSALDQRLKAARIGKKLSKSLGMDIGIGTTAPSFSAPTPSGETLDLHKALGTITVIDFWASWCKPCRVENPNMVRIYKKYHSKGLNIIGVSLDKDHDNWVAAIKKDELQWQHVSNLQYWNEPIAKMYGVMAIPATIILDAQGVIIEKNLRNDDLEAKIAALLPPSS